MPNLISIERLVCNVQSWQEETNIGSCGAKIWDLILLLALSLCALVHRFKSDEGNKRLDIFKNALRGQARARKGISLNEHLDDCEDYCGKGKQDTDESKALFEKSRPHK